MTTLLDLTEQQSEIQRVAREFAHAEIAPNAERWDREALFDEGVARKLGELGFLGMMLPEEDCGLGLDTVMCLLSLEDIAAAEGATSILTVVHYSLPTQMILRCGTDAQNERYLKSMAPGEMRVAFVLSEPEFGSDAAGLRC